MTFVNSDNVDLGTACGKYFRVSCLSIIDAGRSKFYFSSLCCFLALNYMVNEFGFDISFVCCFRRFRHYQVFASVRNELVLFFLSSFFGNSFISFIFYIPFYDNLFLLLLIDLCLLSSLHLSLSFFLYNFNLVAFCSSIC